MESLVKRLKGKAPDRPVEHAKSGTQGERNDASYGPAGPARLNDQRSSVKQLGLSELSSTDSEDGVDIVLVHGLKGHPYDTWSWTNKNVNFFWPAHVAGDIANARVMTYGYDADPSSVLGRVGQNRLGEHAYDLLNAMARKRGKTNTEERPILWISHSLGGLVVEKALTVGDACAETEKHLKAIADNTKGVITLGTPHAGSDFAAWAEITSRILRGVHVNKDLIQTLTANSEVLRDTNLAFGRFLNRRKDRSSSVNVKPFHETLPITGVGWVVSIASAGIFEYASESISGNHMDMTKFSSREDDGYEKVVGTVSMWRKGWLDPMAEADKREQREKARQEKERQEEEQQRREQEEKNWQACLNCLLYAELEAFHDQSRAALLTPEVNTFHHRSTSALNGTFDWIFTDTLLGFQQWLLDPRDFYWIQGKPGSGKTTLMRHLVGSERLFAVVDTKIIVAAHYFQVGASDLARSYEGMLRSILWQLAQQISMKALSPLVECHKLARITGRACFLERELEASLVEIAKRCPGEALCLFIDGLDEHIGKDKDLADKLKRLRGFLPQSSRVCISSRPYPDFDAEFGSSKGLSMQDSTGHDIWLYVEQRLQDATAFGIGLDTASKLTNDIVNMAHGSFLWTKLTCDDLENDWRRHRSADKLQERLLATPKALLPFYQRIWDELDDEEAMELNHMIIVLRECDRYLTPDELCFAIENDRNSRKLAAARQAEWKFFDELTQDDWTQTSQLESLDDLLCLAKELSPQFAQARNPYCHFSTGHEGGTYISKMVKEGGNRFRKYQWAKTAMARQETYKKSLSCRKRVELAGRGFLTVTKENKVVVAHETMLGFWLTAYAETFGGKGHELLLIASSCCLAALHRRYPAFTRVQNEFTAFDRSCRDAMHVFESYAMLDHRAEAKVMDFDTYFGRETKFLGINLMMSDHILEVDDYVIQQLDFIVEVIPAGLAQVVEMVGTHDIKSRLVEVGSQNRIIFHARHLDTYKGNAKEISTPWLPCFMGPPLEFWMTIHETALGDMGSSYHQVLGLGMLVGQASPQALLLKFLISARCYSLACAYMDDIRKHFSSHLKDANQVHSSGSNSTVQSQPDLEAQTSVAVFDVNECGGYLLWLAFHHDNQDVVTRLFSLGAKVGPGLPFASKAMHRAIELDNTNFVHRLLELTSADKIDTPTVLYCDREYTLQDGSEANGSPWSELNDCLAVVTEFKICKGMTIRMAPLLMACMLNRPSMVSLLLSYYPDLESLMGSRGLALVAVAWCGMLEMASLLLPQASLSIDEQRQISGNMNAGQAFDLKSLISSEDQYAAMLAAVYQGNCDVLDLLLRTGLPLELPLDLEPGSGSRIRLITIDLSLTPLHLALKRFGSRSAETSRIIVESLLDAGAIFDARLKEEALPELVEEGCLQEEDRAWLLSLSSDEVFGPPDSVRARLASLNEQLQPEHMYDGFSDEGSFDFDQSSTASSSSGSDQEFFDAEES